MQTILIVDDHQYARKAIIAALLELFPAAQILEAETLTEARAHLACNRFYLALVDLSLPDGSGIDLLFEISSASPGTYLVVATIFDDDQHIFNALRAGTQGYLLKDLSHDEMVAQLNGILSGQPPLSPSVARRILQYFNTSQTAQPLPVLQKLTERELEILMLVAKGLSRTKIAKMLTISHYTVADHIRNIYQKLNIHSRVEAVLEAQRLGLVNSQ